MVPTLKELGIDRLPAHERAALAEALWESLEPVDQSDAEHEMTPALWAEIERRLDEADANPDDLVSWEEFKASLLAEPD